jgi:hypothetical protein
MPAIILKLISFIPMIWEIIKKIIPFIHKKEETLIAFCDDYGSFYDFKEHVVIPDYDVLHKSLMKVIKRARKKGEVLILNFSDMKQFNNDTSEAIRECLRDAVIHNNIRLRAIFPKKGMNDLYKELSKLINQKDCKSISIKRVG